MKTCLICRESVHDDAIKCRYCQSLFVAPPEAPPATATADTRNVTYILDVGLLRFAKFVAAVFAVFILVGTYLFGIKLEVTIEKMKTAQAALEKSADTLKTLNTTAATIKSDVERYRDETRALVQEIESNRSTALALVAEIHTRSLSPSEATRLQELQRTSPTLFREGNLWPQGATLTVRFLDGNQRQTDAFKRAFHVWLQSASLKVRYNDAGPAQIRVSFSEPDCWAFQGTSALGTEADAPTISLGCIQVDNDIPRNYLHEIGHVLGLVHEFKNPQAHLPWKKQSIYASLTKPPNSWSKEHVDSIYFRPEHYPGARPFDSSSIMMLYVPGEFLRGGKEFVMPPTLSESDKRYVRALYP